MEITWTMNDITAWAEYRFFFLALNNLYSTWLQLLLNINPIADLRIVYMAEHKCRPILKQIAHVRELIDHAGVEIDSLWRRNSCLII